MSLLRVRLSRIAPALTARERVVVLLHALRSGAEPDPDLLGSMPSEQMEEYNRFVALEYAANHHLAPLAHLIGLVVVHLQADHECLGLLDRCAAEAGEESIATSMRRLRADSRKSLRDEAEFYWRDLRALDIVCS